MRVCLVVIFLLLASGGGVNYRVHIAFEWELGHSNQGFSIIQLSYLFIEDIM